ncbi:DNA polymerase V subunit UmuC, partial [Acinetobacter baumannii]|nr:DNA polymerase V subunit UmuC [Acinetobacter baumannii]
QLIDKAVIICSNNDGCVVARSNEAKSLGIKMGVPIFKIQDIIERNSVVVLSSNYTVYGEMSRRFHSIINQFVTDQEMEVYSIDEAWLLLTNYESL